MEKKETKDDGTKEVKKVTVIHYNPITKQVYKSSEIVYKKDKKVKVIVIFVLIALMVSILLCSFNWRR